MLVVVSDLHLTDGSSGETIQQKAFKIFRTRLSDMAYDASFKEKVSNGKTIEYYEPIQEMSIILLGDIFDIIRSDNWLDGTVKPWSNPHSDHFYNKVKTITQNIIEANEDSLRVIKSIANGHVTIPSAVTINKESITNEISKERQSVNVKIYYMVGNHDWFFVLENSEKHPDNDYNTIRQLVVDALGLSNDPYVPFPHIIPQSGETIYNDIQSLMLNHSMYGIHGDVFDKQNCSFDKETNAPLRAQSSFGDVVVVELLNRIPLVLEQKMGDRLPAGLIKRIKEIDNVRPYSLIPNWIDHVLHEYNNEFFSSNNKLYDEIVGEIVTLLEEFCSNEALAKLDESIHPMLSDIVGQFLSLLPNSYKLFTVGASILNRFSNGKEHRIESYRDQMLDFTKNFDPQYKYFVMGHTHYQEMVPLRPTQLYFNTGTWRQIHDLPLKDNAKNDFWNYKIMTYVSFYLEDERKHHNFEFWNGSLDE